MSCALETWVDCQLVYVTYNFNYNRIGQTNERVFLPSPAVAVTDQP